MKQGLQGLGFGVWERRIPFPASRRVQASCIWHLLSIAAGYLARHITGQLLQGPGTDDVRGVVRPGHDALHRGLLWPGSYLPAAVTLHADEGLGTTIRQAPHGPVQLMEGPISGKLRVSMVARTSLECGNPGLATAQRLTPEVEALVVRSGLGANYCTVIPMRHGVCGGHCAVSFRGASGSSAIPFADASYASDACLYPAYIAL